MLAVKHPGRNSKQVLKDRQSEISYKIGKASFGLTEAVNTEPQKEAGDRHAHRQIRQMERTLATENAPAEAVNDPYHRVEGVDEPPLFGDDTRAEPDR